MATFGMRPTPNDCIARLNNALDEIAAIRALLAATPGGEGPQGDWDANRKRSQAHLADAWASIGWALRALWFGQRDRIRDEDVAAAVASYGRDITALRTEVKRLESALALARADAQSSASYAANAPMNGSEDMAQRLRRHVMGALHPDRAADAAEGVWRTTLCQTLFPEIDRIISGR